MTAVSPSYKPIGWMEGLPVFSCNECSTVVTDQYNHTAFHRDILDLAYKAPR